MSYEAYRYIFIIALILCGVLFIVAALLFFLLDIPKIIRDLSGITAKRAIREIREQNEATGDKTYKVSQVNRDRGKLTDKISQSGRIVKRSETMKIGYGVETAKIATARTDVQIPEGNETTVLGAETSVLSSETTVLANETTVLGAEPATAFTAGETAVLSETGNTAELSAEMAAPAAEENTTVLGQEDTALLTQESAPVSQATPAAQSFVIEFDITLIHTNETIDMGAM